VELRTGRLIGLIFSFGFLAIMIATHLHFSVPEKIPYYYGVIFCVFHFFMILQFRPSTLFQKKYDTMVRFLPLPILLVNKEVNRIIEVNPEAKKTFSDPEELFDIIRENIAREQDSPAIGFQLNHGESSFECTAFWLQDPVFYFEILAVVFNDITSKMEIEKIREKFYSISSHELRSPIAAIRAYLDIAQFDPSYFGQENPESIIPMLQKNIKRLTFLVTNLQDFNRVQKDVWELSLRKVRIPELFGRVQSELSLIFPTDNINTKFSCSDEGSIEMDLDNFIQMVVNLVENAVNHSPKQSEVNVKLDISEGNLILVVSDKGAGIAHENRDEIFKPFVTIATKYQLKGTGIGLYLVKKIIEGHRGYIELDSKQDGGATFHITIPRRY